MGEKKIRIGIDVGGTFTHAVAVDHSTYKVVAHAVTPTTHTSQYSVSEGIIKVFNDIMSQTGVSADDVVFVAHSTTQATNALLEGDVAKVGIVGMGKGMESLKAKSDTMIKDIELSQGKFLKTSHRYFNTESKNFSDEEIVNSIEHLKSEGCRVVVASEAFGVDDSSNENKVVEIAARMGIDATASHEISQLYGLKIRTRTAVINASILPKMTHTAELTNKSIKKSGISTPLMIMRSDGGVMDIVQMEKRPILTMLSGPAAGIAAALMFAKVSDGIFLEVGGTSTDISAIKNGKAMVKSANVGGHITYLKTLDSRTVGIGGGSMVRMENEKVFDVGPRSAHIAGLGYIAFSNIDELKNLKPILISPLPSDPNNYLAVENEKGDCFAITLTDASIMAGMTKKGDYAFGNYEGVKQVFEMLAEHYNTQPGKFAQDILDKAAKKVEKVVDELLDEYHLDRELVSLVGGGGGATSVVPWLSGKMNMNYLVVEKAEVISAIGAAMAMLRDTVERTVVDPKEGDIISIRKQAINSLLEMGADINTIEVQTEIDQKKNILRAAATGSMHMDSQSFNLKELNIESLRNVAAKSLKTEPMQVEDIANTKSLRVFSNIEHTKKFFGLFSEIKRNFRVLDNYGVIKLQINNGSYMHTISANAVEDITCYVEQVSKYSDVGRVVPELFLIYGRRIVDFSSVLDYKQLMNLIQVELKGLDQKETVIVITQPR